MTDILNAPILQIQLQDTVSAGTVAQTLEMRYNDVNSLTNITSDVANVNVVAGAVV